VPAFPRLPVCPRLDACADARARAAQLLAFVLFGPRLPPLTEGAAGDIRPRGASAKHAPALPARRLRPHVAGREADADVPYHVREGSRARARGRTQRGAVGASTTAPRRAHVARPGGGSRARRPRSHTQLSGAGEHARGGGDAGEGSEAGGSETAPRKARRKARKAKRAPAVQPDGATDDEPALRRPRAKPRAKAAKAAPLAAKPKPKPKAVKKPKAKAKRTQGREKAQLLVAPALAVPAHPHNAAGFDPTRIETLSLDKPRAFVYHGFLSEAECDHMVAISTAGLHKSGVVDAETGGSLISDIRTSSGAFIGRRADATIAAIEARIAIWSQIPEDHGEAMQVLRYELGQEYRAHYDYFFHKAGEANNRVATVLLYLSDVEEGGETVFPNTAAPVGRQGDYSACGQQGLAVKAKKGNALLFWSMKVGGELDGACGCDAGAAAGEGLTAGSRRAGGSSHAGCPVIKGTKWTATKWCALHSCVVLWPPEPSTPPLFALALTASLRAGCTWRRRTCRTRTSRCTRSRAPSRWLAARTGTTSAGPGRSRASASATRAS